MLNPTRMTSDNNNQSQAQTLHIITDTVLPNVPSTSTLCFNQLLIAIQHFIQFCQTYVQTIFINNLAFFITKLSGSSANYSLISAFFIFFFYFKPHIHLSILASVLSKFTSYVFRRRQWNLTAVICLTRHHTTRACLVVVHYPYATCTFQCVTDIMLYIPGVINDDDDDDKCTQKAKNDAVFTSCLIRTEWGGSVFHSKQAAASACVR